MSITTVTLARYLFERLVQLGVDCVFGLPGDFSLPLLDELEVFDDLSWVGTASELGASYAADGYARARGLGVIATTFGVGELGAAGGVAGSMAEDVGVLHLVSSPSTGAMASGAKVHHTLADGDHSRFLRIAKEITRTQHLVSATNAVDDIDRALAEWAASRRATYLLIPQDLSLLRVSAYRLTQPLVAAPADEEISARARELFARFFASHPRAVAVGGHLVARWGRKEILQTLASRGARVAVLPNAKGAIDESISNYLGVYNGKLSEPATRDVVESDDGRVLIGCTLADTTTGGLSHRFGPRSTVTMSHDGVCWGDEMIYGIRFVDLLSILTDEWPEAAKPPVVPRPVFPLSAVKAGALDSPLTQDQLWATVAAILPPHTRVFVDTGTSHYGALDICFPEDTAFEPAPIWSAIGFALPAALGASVGDRSRRVVAIVGDGATQLVAHELGLIHRTRINPIIVLVNNGGYTVERVIRGPRASYNDIAAWDWPLVPRAFGVPESSMTTVSVDDVESFSAALGRAVNDPERAHFIEAFTGVLDTPPTLAVMARMLRAKAEIDERG